MGRSLFGATLVVVLGVGAVGALLRCPSGSGGFGSCLPDMKFALGNSTSPAAPPDEKLRITARVTPPTTVSAAKTGWSEALIAGSFDLLPAEPGRSRTTAAATQATGESTAAVSVDVTGSTTTALALAPVPQSPPPALARQPAAVPAKVAETVPADPALVTALERLDARIRELRTPPPTPATDEVAPTPATKPAAFASSSSDTRIVGGQGVSVRSGPSTSNDRLFALASGQKVTVIGKQRGWLQITDARGRSGWAYSSYLRNN